MSIVDRVNGFVLARIGRGRRDVRIVGSTVRQGPTILALSDVSGIVAHDIDVHAGTLLALTLVFADGRTWTVSADEPVWTDLIAALDRLNLTSVPSRDWIAALVSGTANAGAIVLRGGGDALAQGRREAESP